MAPWSAAWLGWSFIQYRSRCSNSRAGEGRISITPLQLQCVPDPGRQFFRRARNDFFRHLEFLDQPFVVFKSVGNDEGMHACSGRGKIVLVLVAANIGQRRIDAKAFPQRAEGGGLFLAERNVNQEVQCGAIDIVAMKQLPQRFFRIRALIRRGMPAYIFVSCRYTSVSVEIICLRPSLRACFLRLRGNSLSPPRYLNRRCLFWKLSSSPSVMPCRENVASMAV